MRKRLRHYKAILIQPIWVIFIALLSIIGNFQVVVGLLPTDLQQTLAMSNLIPHWPLTTWIIIALVGSLLTVLENAHRVIEKEGKVKDDIITLRDQTIASLNERLQPLDIKLPVEIERDNLRGVGITIHNPTLDIISAITVKLKPDGVFALDSSGRKYVTLVNIPDSKRYFRDGANFASERSILPSREATIYLAEVRDGDVVWLLNDDVKMDDLDLVKMQDVQHGQVLNYDLELIIEAHSKGKPITQPYPIAVKFQRMFDRIIYDLDGNRIETEARVTSAKISIFEVRT